MPPRPVEPGLRSHDPSPHLPLVRWARWVWLGVLKDLSPTARDVGTFLAACAHPVDGAFPAVALIAKKTKHSPTSVFRALQQLVARGILKSGQRRKIGPRKLAGPRVYTIEEPPGSQEAFDLLARADISAARTSVGHLTKRKLLRDQSGRLVRGSKPQMSLREQEQTSLRQGHDLAQGLQRGRGNGDSLIRPPSAALAGASPSGQRASKRVEGERALQNAPAIPTPKQWEAIAGICLPSTPLGNPDGASPVGQRVLEPFSPPSEKGRKIRRRCRGLNWNRSECVVQAQPGSDFCFRHQSQAHRALAIAGANGQ